MAGCAECGLRARYDNKPTSILGRLWRWHINWCPGWKRYLNSLSEEDRKEIRKKYGQ